MKKILLAVLLLTVVNQPVQAQIYEEIQMELLCGNDGTILITKVIEEARSWVEELYEVEADYVQTFEVDIARLKALADSEEEVSEEQVSVAYKATVQSYNALNVVRSTIGSYEQTIQKLLVRKKKISNSHCPYKRV